MDVKDYWWCVAAGVIVAAISFHCGALSERIDPEPLHPPELDVCVMPLPERVEK